MKYLTILLSVFLLIGSVQAETHKDIQKFENDVQVLNSRRGGIRLAVNTVTTTTDSGASTETITGLIPAGALCLSVVCEVTTVLAGSGLTTWSLGDGVDANLYGGGLAKTAGTVVNHSTYTASPLTQAWGTSAKNLTMTAAAGVFTTGEIVCACAYIDTVTFE
ncbi:MAG: hypothetical protein KC483_10210 [Nitrosarchaeum sp.]|nr:hypothetical protein [Nitrosarchaeum sp.]